MVEVVIDHWGCIVQDPWVCRGCFCQDQAIRLVCRKVPLRVDILVAEDGRAKGFFLGDCPYCNIRPAGLGQNGLCDEVMLDGRGAKLGSQTLSKRTRR